MKKSKILTDVRRATRNAMRRWLHAASDQERATLAKRARTSVAQLYQIAGGYRKGGRPWTNAELAGRLAMGAAALQQRNPELPGLYREDLCLACSQCPYAKRCLAASIL